MNNIKQLKANELHLIESFISDNLEDYKFFYTLGWNKTGIQRHFKKNNNFSLGYFYKNNLCGLLIGEKIRDKNSFDLEIHIIFVSKCSRRKKIGSDILKFIENNKEQTKVSKIYLEVSEYNFDAIKFYEKNNFVFLNFRHNYYNVNKKNVNAKCYYKKII